MKTFDVKFSTINPDYNAEYAETWGKWLDRQYENPKFINENSWRTDNATEYRYRPDVSFELLFSDNNGMNKCELKNVCVLEVLKDKEIISEFVVSKSLISSTRDFNRQRSQKGYMYFYLRPDIDFTLLSDFIYISKKEIPEEFITKLKEYQLLTIHFKPTAAYCIGFTIAISARRNGNLNLTENDSTNDSF